MAPLRPCVSTSSASAVTRSLRLCARLVFCLVSQLVCLSATLPNIECLAKWLDASLYRTEYRPVELRHFVCKGREVYRPRRAGLGGAEPGERDGGGEGTLEKASVFVYLCVCVCVREREKERVSAICVRGEA